MGMLPITPTHVQARKRIDQSPLDKAPAVPKGTTGEVQDFDRSAGMFFVDFGHPYGVVMASPDELTVVRRRNPAREPTFDVFDTQNPGADPDTRLGYAAVYDGIRMVLRGWHVTNDAQKVMEALARGKPLIDFGDADDELGPGFYVSAVPHLWMGRSTQKWSFLERMADEDRSTLSMALNKILLRQVQDQYITEGEYKRATKGLDRFVESVKDSFYAIELADQPYNISFWKPEFLEPLGLKTGKRPEVVEVELKGVFAGFTDMPARKQLTDIAMKGLSGIYLRGGLMTMAQMCVIRNEAIVKAVPGVWNGGFTKVLYAKNPRSKR